jgi:hypothetical protein
MELETLKTLTALIGVIMAPILMAIFSMRFPPSWKDKGPLAPYWSKINLSSLGTAIILSILTFFLYNGHIIEYKFIAALSVSVMTFIFGQTLFTDFTQRLADRKVMMIANLISLAAGLWFIMNFDKPMLNFYIIFGIVATALIFLPTLGDSDGRAAQLAVFSTFPIISFNGLSWGIIGTLIAIILFAFCYAVKNKTLKTIAIARISIPMVPLLIAPFIVTVILAGVLPIR